MSVIFDEDLFKIVVAPEYKDIDDDKLEAFYNEALLEVSPTKWGKWHPRGWGLMTAHLLKISEISENSSSGSGIGTTSQLKKTKVGDLEREYVVSENKDSDTLDLTVYGKELKRLRKRFLKSPVIVVC